MPVNVRTYSTRIGAGRQAAAAAARGERATGRVFTITVTDFNEAPTAIALPASSVAENRSVGTAVGTLSSTDPDAGSTFTYALVSGTGAADNASFSIQGNELRTAAVFSFATRSSSSIRIRSTDGGGPSTERVFPISVTKRSGSIVTS